MGGGGSQEYPPLTAKISGLPPLFQNPGQDTYLPPSLKTQVSTYPPPLGAGKIFRLRSALKILG